MENKFSISEKLKELIAIAEDTNDVKTRGKLMVWIAELTMHTLRLVVESKKGE